MSSAQARIAFARIRSVGGVSSPLANACKISRSLFVNSIREAQFTFTLGDTRVYFQAEQSALRDTQSEMFGWVAPLFVAEERKHNNGYDVEILAA